MPQMNDFEKSVMKFLKKRIRKRLKAKTGSGLQNYLTKRLMTNTDGYWIISVMFL